jgi:hypothetical protein
MSLLRLILILSPVSISSLRVVSFGQVSIPIFCTYVFFAPTISTYKAHRSFTTPFSVRKQCPLHRMLELSCSLENNSAPTVGNHTSFIFGRFRLQISAQSPTIVEVSSVPPDSNNIWREVHIFKLFIIVRYKSPSIYLY